MDPEAQEALRAEVQGLLRSGQAPEALRALRAAGRGPPLPFPLRLLEARALVDAGLEPRARLLLAHLQPLAADLHARFQLADLAEQAGDPARARQLLREVLAEDDDYGDARQRLARLSEARAPGLEVLRPLEALEKRYRKLHFLGRGAAAVVYSGHDPVARRDVAIKLLNRHHADEPARRRFLREARLLQRLDHPHVVRVHAVDLDPVPHYVMDLVRGETLQARVQHGGPLDPPAATRLALQLLDALEYVHERRVVHRDLKPSNVLLDEAGTAFLSDFGLAGADDASRITASGQAMGSLGYVADEQLGGVVDDPRSDLFGLGATLYYALAGHRPFRLSASRGGDPERVPIGPLDAALEQVHGPRHGVSSGLVGFVTKLMATDPSERYQSATEAALELQRGTPGPG